MSNRSTSQEAKLVRWLRSHNWWQPMPRLCRVTGSLNIHSRVSSINRQWREDNRKSRIINKVQREGATKKSFYKLTP